MRPLASPIVALLFMFASKVAAQTLRETHVVDYRTLKTCDSKTDCLGWQVCATCVHTQVSILAKYCSDLTYRGICGYRDEGFFCSCDEDSLDKPQAQREGMQKIVDMATSQGGCIFDKDCDESSPGQNYRCSTCIQAAGGIVSNVCTNPESTDSLCNPSGPFSKQCSCGQLYPEPQRNYLAQPVAAANEIDLTGFMDQTADSVQAGIIPGDGDWAGFVCGNGSSGARCAGIKSPNWSSEYNRIHEK